MPVNPGKVNRAPAVVHVPVAPVIIVTVYDVLDVHVTLKHAGRAAPAKPVCIRDDSKHRLAGPMMSPLAVLVLRVGSAHTPLENGRNAGQKSLKLVVPA